MAMLAVTIMTIALYSLQLFSVPTTAILCPPGEHGVDHTTYYPMYTYYCPTMITGEHGVDHSTYYPMCTYY